MEVTEEAQRILAGCRPTLRFLTAWNLETQFAYVKGRDERHACNIPLT